MKEFTSTICTTIKQSRKLLECGVSPATADMHWHYDELGIGGQNWTLCPYTLTPKEEYVKRNRKLDLSSIYKHPDGTPMTVEEVYELLCGKDVPAWSLPRLLEMMPHQDEDETGIKTILTKHSVIVKEVHPDRVEFLHAKFRQEANCGKKLFDSVVSTISWLIQTKRFYKGYLNQSPDKCVITENQ